MPDRSRDWLRQAEIDLEAAEDMARAGHHEWACFAAQQSAEKAVKAIHYSLRQEVKGHSLVKMLTALPQVPADVVDKARVLDRLYIQPRYPNGFSEGVPRDYYGPLESEQAIAYAHEILAFGRLQMAD